jgi:DNA-directed RNA polymerase subunit beta'
MGRLIPAGTGLPAYRRLRMIVEDDGTAPAYSTPAPAPRREEPLSAVNEE